MTGCGGDGVNTPELAAALEKARPDNEAPDQRAAKEPLPFAGAGAHRAVDRFELTLTFEDGVRKLVVDRVITRGADGAFRVAQTRRWIDPALAAKGRDDGREAVFDGQRFATRRASGPWREREVWRGDHHAWLRQAYAVGPGMMRAYGPMLDLSREGTAEVAGLSASASR